jgi:hypothetical protein
MTQQQAQKELKSEMHNDFVRNLPFVIMTLIGLVTILAGYHIFG